MTKKYYWLKLQEDFFRDKRIKKLRMIAGGTTYIIIYQKMLLLSLQREGVLLYEGIETSFAKEIALDIDEKDEDVEMTIHYLKETGLLQESETYEREYNLLQAQFLLGSETSSAQRVRKHRGKEKALIEMKYYDDDSLNNLFKDFLRLRNKLKAVNSERAIQGLINKLEPFDDNIKKLMINESIISSWKSVFELKKDRINYYVNNKNLLPRDIESDWLDDYIKSTRK